MGGVVGLYLVNAVQMPARNPASRFAGRKPGNVTGKRCFDCTTVPNLMLVNSSSIHCRAMF